jgi:adenine-specific DNA-methyltransferase
MSSQIQRDGGVVSRPRFSGTKTQKSSGATYTPAPFADFVATQIVGAADLPNKGRIRILDPAMGEGALLRALIRHLPETCWPRLDVVGFDTNCDAIQTASLQLKQEFPRVNFNFEERDFLEFVLSNFGKVDLRRLRRLMLST